MLADGPSAYYRLGDVSAGALDSSGHGHGGTFYNVNLGLPGALEGDSNTSALFNGTNSIVDTGFSVLNSSFTIEAWIQPSQYEAEQHVIAGVDGSAQLLFNGSASPGLLQMGFYNGTAFRLVSASSAIPTDSWSHVAGVWNNSTKNLSVFVNGSLRGNRFLPGEVPELGGPYPYFQIGGFNEDLHGGSYQAQFFNGGIDEVAYYASALSADRIAEHYRAGTQHPCPVDKLTDPPSPHTNVADLDSSKLHPDMQSKLGDFQAAIEALGGTYRPISFHRTEQLQDHFREVRDKFVKLVGGESASSVPILDGIGREIVAGPTAQQARLTLVDGSPGEACRSLIDMINYEIEYHGIAKRTSYTVPAVETSNASKHVQLPAIAIDVATGLTTSQKKLAAEAAGLRHVYGNHYELKDDPMPLNLEGTIIVESPVNALVQDPLGRRLGFDPISGDVVNDFGPLARYSGAGSEPQIMIIPLGDVVPGTYQVSGIGTGDGPYTIRMEIAGEDDPSQLLVSRILATGAASLGTPIEPVSTSLFVVPEPKSTVLALIAVLSLFAISFSRACR